MDRSYWEKIAPDYNAEIFDVLHQDKKGIIRRVIKRLAGKDKTVLDAGCAIGKWLPVLSPVYGHVVAADISAKNLAIAQRQHQQYDNIQYERIDFSNSRAKLPKSDVVICINAILTDSMKKRDAFFNNLSKAVKKGGSLVLVVPSMESYLFTRIIQQKWRIDHSLFNQRIAPSQGLKKYKNVQQGNLDIDNVATKHYIREELFILLNRQGFEITEVKKIEYDWKTEFIKPPSWLKDPRPWDWLVVAKK